MSCSRTQGSDSGDARTAAPLSQVKHSTTELPFMFYDYCTFILPELEYMYSKTCVKRPLKKRENEGYNDNWYPLEHAIFFTALSDNRS